MSGIRAITVNTASKEEAHIYAEDDAAIFQSLFGTDGVSSIGKQCEATILSNNKVRIADGVLCVGGHFARIPYGDYEEVEIENGKSGEKRNDIICIRFTTTGTGGVDTIECAVKKGESGNTAKDPVLVQENIYGGEKTREFPLYRVKIEDLSITKVEKMFSIIPTSKELLDEINKIRKTRCITKSGSIVVNIPERNDSVKIFSCDDINKLLGVKDSTNVNTTVLFANGDGGAVSAHLEGTTYLNNEWYAVINKLTTGKTRFRVNYMIMYSGEV